MKKDKPLLTEIYCLSQQRGQPNTISPLAPWCLKAEKGVDEFKFYANWVVPRGDEFNDILNAKNCLRLFSA